jgi:hypothetical protein
MSYHAKAELDDSAQQSAAGVDQLDHALADSPTA